VGVRSQHCAKKHLHHYVAEFEFRYGTRQANGFDDRARAMEAAKSIMGNRLTCRRIDSSSTPASA